MKGKFYGKRRTEYGLRDFYKKKISTTTLLGRKGTAVTSRKDLCVMWNISIWGFLLIGGKVFQEIGGRIVGILQQKQ